MRLVVKAEYLFNAIPRRDLGSWNAMISCYSRNGYSPEARSLFKKLTHQCSQLSVSTVLAVISSWISPDSLQFGKSIHCWGLKAGLSTDILIVNSLVNMYVNSGDLPAAFMLLEGIHAEKDFTCWNTIIAGCTRNGHFREALAAFNWMRQEINVIRDSIALVNVISTSGNLALIYSPFSRLAISLEFQGREDKSMAKYYVFHKMCESGVRQSKSSFISLLSACSHSGLVNEGPSYYRVMLGEYGVEAVTEHHVCVEPENSKKPTSL
ncbi:hypothetical protein F3Y22_tig00110469pilonHSYRG00114 [Hibiscus syriacus]|uniref:Pentatricopeptide repeat-containing protein n=1 Tax=Hibiscus syriacus TaxID=106335 RepID=A0A6A3AI22_HIBSY|nr:hypothetical protein F3Y22_tig00110469pilonHSYRG00114 [Hibiscus syriacus]